MSKLIVAEKAYDNWEKKKKVELPYFCEEHPDAKIKHVWDETHWVLNGYPGGTGIKKNHKYYCAECGKELSPLRK